MKLKTLHEASYAFPSAKEVSFKEFKSLVKQKEGIVFTGAGGAIDEWIKGVSNHLHEEGIAASSKPSDLWSDAYVMKTSGGRTDLALVFNDNDALNVGKLAMWRIQFGDASWISDYIANYAKQH